MNARLQASSTGTTHSDLAPSERRPRILLAEDDEYMRRLLAAGLRRDGFEVIEAANGAELVALLGTLVRQSPDGRAVDLIVSDIRMPWANGLRVLEMLRRSDWATPVILITAFGDGETHAEARRLGAAAVFDKPFEIDDLRTAVVNFAGPR